MALLAFQPRCRARPRRRRDEELRTLLMVVVCPALVVEADQVHGPGLAVG